MSAINIALGKSKWAQAEYLDARARAFYEAASAAEAIEAKEEATKWRVAGADAASQAVHLFSEAKSLGFFGA